MKKCTCCGDIKDINEFCKHRRHKDGHSTICNTCSLKKKKIYYVNNRDMIKDKVRNYYYKHTKERLEYAKKYQKIYISKHREHRVLAGLKQRDKHAKIENITEESLKDLLKKQKGICFVCGYPKNDEVLVLDHDHKTGEIRGWAHKMCNRFFLSWLDNQIAMHPESQEELLKVPLFKKVLMDYPAKYLYKDA